MENEQRRRGYLFHDVADVYDQARPQYPAQLFNDLARRTPITPFSHVLEIGCGTGIATKSLAELGCHIVAIDPGAEMIAVASKRLRDTPQVQCIVTSFEEYCITPHRQFNAVIAATSYHWLDPAVREKAVWNLLLPSGIVAIFRHWGRVGGDESFFRGIQEIYQKYAPALLEEALRAAAGDPSAISYGHIVPFADDAIAAHTDVLEQDDLWDEMEYSTYPWDQEYSSAEYINLLSTYSDNLMLAPDVRERLFVAIRSYIDTHHSGHVRKAYVTAMRSARKRLAVR